MGEKTEKPTEKKLRDARSQGNLARSRTLAGAVAALAGFATLVALAPPMASRVLAYGRASFLSGASNALSPAQALSAALEPMALLSLPILGAAFLGSLAGSALQTGVVFNAGALTPKFDRLNPAEGAKKLFSGKNVVELLKNSLLVTVVLYLAYAAARDAVPVLTRLPEAEGFRGVAAVLDLVSRTGTRCLVAIAALGALDFLYQRHAWMKGLMMSREDVKREHKEQEGDPHHKAKRKQLHRSFINGTARRAVEQAKVVVVNPTHVAVALAYDPDACDAPTIVAKGIDEEAAKIRHLARRHKVPIHKDIPLARTLVRYDVGEPIPEELYEAVAAVLRTLDEADQAGTPAALPLRQTSPRSPR